MAKHRQVPWNKIILEEFIEIGGLTKSEEMVMRTRFAGWSRTEQALKMDMSIATIDRIIAKCKIKYDDCQKYSAILPPRATSKQEHWQDTH